MKHLKKGLFVGLLLFSTDQVFGAAGRDVATNTYACCTGNCQQVNCQSGTANAVGDTRMLDVNNVNFSDLGNISATKPIFLDVPTEDLRVGYVISFASAGKFANQRIQFITNYETEAGQVVYKFYRRLPGAKVWTEVGSVHATKPLSSLEVIITPDGAVIFINNGKNGIMYIATEAGNVPQAAKSKL